MITDETTSRYAQAGDLRLHYNEVGSGGTPVVCLHDGAPAASAWGNFGQNVGPLAQQFRVLLVDMPQFGKSEKIIIQTGRSTYISRVLCALMDTLDIRKLHLIGFSLGGQVAIKFAIDFPERVDKLLVIGSTPVPFSLFCPVPLEGPKITRQYYGGEGPTAPKMRQILETMVYDPSVIADEMVQARYLASIDPEVVRVMTAPISVREDLSDQLDRVQARSLLVWGTDDRFGALDVGLLMLRKFQDAQMHLFSRCGHWAQLERADEFNRLALDFLAN